MSTMLVVMTERTVLKVPFEKAAPPCPSDVPAPLIVSYVSVSFSSFMYNSTCVQQVINNNINIKIFAHQVKCRL